LSIRVGVNLSRAMFKKPGSKNEDPLANRMRKISGAPVGVPEEITYSSVQQTNKRAERTATFKQGTITTRGGERIPVVVKNVSSTGARIEFFRDVQLGDHVLLSEPTLQIRTWAEVVWQGRGAAGLNFVRT
jgi:hypothetical protein